jgi:hypothetical protein
VNIEGGIQVFGLDPRVETPQNRCFTFVTAAPKHRCAAREVQTLLVAKLLGCPRRVASPRIKTSTRPLLSQKSNLNLDFNFFVFFARDSP